MEMGTGKSKVLNRQRISMLYDKGKINGLAFNCCTKRGISKLVSTQRYLTHMVDHIDKENGACGKPI